MSMRLALAQINTVVGDLTGNEERIRAAYQKGENAGADLVVLPELAIAGYPPRDLLLKEGFIARNREVLDWLAASTGETGMVVGYVGEPPHRPAREAANSVALLHRGRVIATRHKSLLPTYDVFDEDRYFEPATENSPVAFKQRRLGLTICEDVWNAEDFWRDRRYRSDPVTALVAAGAEILLNVSASPWHLGKNRIRHAMLSSLARRSGCPVVYCNLVGGNDELIFDGTSLVFNGSGEVVAQGAAFDEDFVFVDLAEADPVRVVDLSDEEKIYRALVLGLRDYLTKCGFSTALIGLSGGIDSALVAALAAAALGPENVRGVSLPSQYSSTGSVTDAERLAANLGIRFDVVPIKPSFDAVLETLKPLFNNVAEDVTEENIQARLRGVMLMALSNKFGGLLLTTGNKSELAVGYCTLYGDMCGGLSVINDVPKTMVYRLARWINRDREIIPEATITKPPSAELRPDQTDQDTLPPYELLDSIIDRYVVEGQSVKTITAAGFDGDTVRRIVRLIGLAEYKRRQAAPGLKVTSKAFGVGRRIPIAQRWAE